MLLHSLVPNAKKLLTCQKLRLDLPSTARSPWLTYINKSKGWKEVFYTSGLHASVQICSFPSSEYLSQGDRRVKVSLLPSQRSAIAGEGKGGKGLAGFHPLFGHLQNTETWWCSLLAQKNLFDLVVMVQLKPSCSHSSSIQIVFNSFNKWIFLSSSPDPPPQSGQLENLPRWHI